VSCSRFLTQKITPQVVEHFERFWINFERFPCGAGFIKKEMKPLQIVTV
jgi:hypothetical protein